MRSTRRPTICAIAQPSCRWTVLPGACRFRKSTGSRPWGRDHPKIRTNQEAILLRQGSGVIFKCRPAHGGKAHSAAAFVRPLKQAKPAPSRPRTARLSPAPCFGGWVEEFAPHRNPLSSIRSHEPGHRLEPILPSGTRRSGFHAQSLTTGFSFAVAGVRISRGAAREAG